MGIESERKREQYNESTEIERGSSRESIRGTQGHYRQTQPIGTLTSGYNTKGNTITNIDIIGTT